MNTHDLLTATFADHEADAPDVADTLRGIEAEIAGHSRRRPVALTAVAACAVVATVAVAPALLRGHSGADKDQTATQPGGPRTASATASAAPSLVAHVFPFRPGQLPPGAKLDHVEITSESHYFLEGYSFGAVPDQVRGLTVWSIPGPLTTRLRDGGTLVPTTIGGNAAVEGWSPSSRSYTIDIQRPGSKTVTVLVYGWDESVASAYAHLTAQGMQYGRFPTPHAR